jgi:hypothetical protein
VALPVSSSGVNSSTVRQDRRSAPSRLRAVRAAAMPPRMSNTPGPLIEPACSRAGLRTAVPAGHTVS